MGNTTIDETDNVSTKEVTQSGTKTERDHRSEEEEESDTARARTRLIAFYRTHNVEKLTSVEATLNRYKGRYDMLFLNLAQRYNTTIDETNNVSTSEVTQIETKIERDHHSEEEEESG